VNVCYKWFLTTVVSTRYVSAFSQPRLENIVILLKIWKICDIFDIFKTYIHLCVCVCVCVYCQAYLTKDLVVQKHQNDRGQFARPRTKSASSLFYIGFALVACHWLRLSQVLGLAKCVCVCTVPELCAFPKSVSLNTHTHTDLEAGLKSLHSAPRLLSRASQKAVASWIFISAVLSSACRRVASPFWLIEFFTCRLCSNLQFLRYVCYFTI